MEDARVAHARPELFAAPNHGFAWIRMIGAILVIYGHSSPLVGTGELFPPEWALQPDEGVLMGFFALSGFQITESWRRDPHPARFAAKRVLRLWPPMLTVSFGMALVIGPLVTTLPMGEYFSAKDTWGYIVNNAGLLTLQHDLPGVFSNNPWPDAVNGSLWTLPMELLAYTGLYVLLLLGAAKHNRRWLAVIALVALVLWDRHLEHAPGAESAGSLLSVPVESLVAFLVAFAIGVVLNLYRIPLSPLAAVVGVVVFLLMPNSVTASFWMTIAVSYAVIVTGHFWPARLTVPGLWINGSYGVYVWGFPVQQLLAMAGIGNQYLMLLCATPIAYVLGTLSWAFVEEPTMRLRHYITPQPRDERAEAEDADADDPDDPDEDWGDDVDEDEADEQPDRSAPGNETRPAAPPPPPPPPPPSPPPPGRHRADGARPSRSDGSPTEMIPPVSADRRRPPPGHRPPQPGRAAPPPRPPEESVVTRRLAGRLDGAPPPDPGRTRGRHRADPNRGGTPAPEPEEETRPLGWSTEQRRRRS